MRITDEAVMDVVKSIDKFDSMKDYILVKAVPIEEIDNNVYNKVIGDVALKISVLVSIDTDTINMISPSKEVVKNWGLTDDELFDLAFENMKRIFRPKFMTLLDAVTKDRILYDEDSSIFEEHYDSVAIFTLVNFSYLNNSAFIFDKEIRRKISEIFGEDYYISFISKNEVVMCPISLCGRTVLKDTLDDVIDAEVTPKDFLSRSVYRYFSKYDVISALVN